MIYFLQINENDFQNQSLEPTNKAEEVAVDMLKAGDLVVNVIDATNLERNLNLTLQLLEKDIPVVVALNMWDETEHKGIDINVEKLEEFLGVPIIPTAAIKNQGIRELTNNFDYQEIVNNDYGKVEDRWTRIGKIIEESFRILTTGIFIPFAAVLPYILAFYFISGLLEDTGYLPRLAVLVDNIMHK